MSFTGGQTGWLTYFFNISRDSDIQHSDRYLIIGPHETWWMIYIYYGYDIYIHYIIYRSSLHFGCHKHFISLPFLVLNAEALQRSSEDAKKQWSLVAIFRHRNKDLRSWIGGSLWESNTCLFWGGISAWQPQWRQGWRSRWIRYWQLEFRGIWRWFHHPNLGFSSTTEGFHQVTIELWVCIRRADSWNLAFQWGRWWEVIAVSHGIWRFQLCRQPHNMIIRYFGQLMVQWGSILSLAG